MNLCSSRHGEVCYEGKSCPACELVKELGEQDVLIAEQKAEISTLKSELTKAGGVPA